MRSGDFLNPHVPLTVVWTTYVPWPPSASLSSSAIKGAPKGEACAGLSSVCVHGLQQVSQGLSAKCKNLRDPLQLQTFEAPGTEVHNKYWGLLSVDFY